MVEGSGTWFDYRPTDRASTSRPAAEIREAIIASHARLRGPVDRALYPKRFRTTARQSQFLGIPNRLCPPSMARGRRPGAIGFPIGNAPSLRPSGRGVPRRKCPPRKGIGACGDSRSRDATVRVPASVGIRSGGEQGFRLKAGRYLAFSFSERYVV